MSLDISGIIQVLDFKVSQRVGSLGAEHPHGQNDVERRLLIRYLLQDVLLGSLFLSSCGNISGRGYSKNISAVHASPCLG